MNRLYWDIMRFFAANDARKFSAFDSRDVISLSQEGSHVTAFTRDGSLLLLLGYQTTLDSVRAPGDAKRPVRTDKLEIKNPAELGLDPEGSYRVVDLGENKYYSGEAVKLADLNGMPVDLTLGRTRILLVVRNWGSTPHLVYFRGADGVEGQFGDGESSFKIDAVEGAPVELYIDSGDSNLQCGTDGFSVGRIPGNDFTIVFVVGNRAAKKRIIVLTDPTCPYCVKLHGEIKKAVAKDPGVAFHVMPYPRNRNDKATYRKCLAVVCGKSEKLLDDAYEGKELPAPTCRSEAVNETIALAERLRIQGTPSMILSDGRIAGGYMDADEILSLIR